MYECIHTCTLHEALDLVHNIDADVDVDVDNRNESYSSIDVGVNFKGCADVEAVSLKFDAQLSVGVIL